MTLKIGRDVQFIKTETAGRDFKESKVVTVCSGGKKITGERKKLQFVELKKISYKSCQLGSLANAYEGLWKYK